MLMKISFLELINHAGQDEGFPETLTEESLIDSLQAIKAASQVHSHPALKSEETSVVGHTMEFYQRLNDKSISLPCPHKDFTYSTKRALDDKQLE